MSAPIDPVNLPLIGPTPTARPVARRRRSGDDDHHPPGDHGDQPHREEPDAEDDGNGFPHVDVRV